MLTNIATVAVYVNDQETAERFWIEQMGFVQKEKKQMGPNSYWLEVAPENAQTHLVIYPKSMMANADEHKASIVFVCEDVEQTYQHLMEKGVNFSGEPQKMQWGTFVQFQDNEGNEYLLKS
ncbi:VOC family protein [Shimazuella sp. AN120528]|uniref:VOC family protein n=1 Tax=Shimazuella soli TaxID=1892854 RepID=UPI001F0FD3A7|nr:VOC family protein [Shimazuella soli]MCH5586443.1 VOC family protein [Shimazuella soli]